MDALHLHRLEARYHLPPARRGEERRLRGLLDEVARERLEAALERLGVPLSEEICIRQVHVPVRLRLSASDAELALEWSLALAQGIDEVLRRGDGVVRYASRAQALLDFAAGVARRDLRRAWAWRQMELAELTAGASDLRAAEALVSALERDGGFVVPVLSALAEARQLSGLVRQLPGSAWPRLARAALEAAGVPRPVTAALEKRPVEKLEPRLQRDFERSPLAASARVSPAILIDSGQPLAQLVMLEIDRGLFFRPKEEVRRLVSTVATNLLAVLSIPSIPSIPSTSQALPAEAPPAEATDHEPVPAASPTASSEEPGQGPDRQRGFTRAGGLLFLLGLIDDLGLAREIAIDEISRGRGVRWALHRLAMTLSSVEEADPAALAFAGLGPGEEPPSAEQEPPTAAEGETLREWRRVVAAALAARLERRGTPPEALLGEVCRRRAEIVADPGWIEVHLSLDEVDTELRRCGLDLDPGFLPWLGVVMRFVYQ